MASRAAKPRLTAEKTCELKDVPASRRLSWSMVARQAGTLLKQPALAATLDHLAHAGLTITTAATSRARSPRSRHGRQPGHARRPRTLPASLAEPLSVALEAGTAFNAPPPTQGLAR
jgi:gamma-glutamyltranspeptidase/glutathione hydrolase